MCYAILEIRYKAASTQVETIKVVDAEALDSRLSALQASNLVERITIFKPERVLRRQTTWAEDQPTKRTEIMKCVLPKLSPHSVT